MKDRQARTLVLMVQLGTPSELSVSSVRSFLREFLSDPRVVRLPRWLWLPILYGVILPFRPKASFEAYQKIWRPEGSPLRYYTQSLLESIEQEAQKISTLQNVEWRLAMRYGTPGLKSVLKEYEQACIRRLIILPLFPQYASSTVGSVFDACSEALHTWRWTPELHFVSQYSDDPDYIQTLAQSIRPHVSLESPDAHLLFSFHGLPKEHLESGDPYYCYCHKTARLVTELLQIPSNRFSVSFQSRLGRAPWLEPYTEEHLRHLVEQGVRTLYVAAPSFSVDCLETLEEIDMRARESFLQAGGKNFHYIPALNDTLEHAQFWIRCVKKFI